MSGVENSLSRMAADKINTKHYHLNSGTCSCTALRVQYVPARSATLREPAASVELPKTPRCIASSV